MATGTIKTQNGRLIKVDGTSNTVTIAANGAQSVSLTTQIPSGYHVLMIGSLRTIGFVGTGYATGTTSAWVRNVTSSSVTGSVTVSFLCEAD